MTNRQVIEAHIVERLEFGFDFWEILEKTKSFFDRHVEHFGNRLVAILDLECLPVEPLPLADRTRYPDIGQEVHFQFVGAIALAGGTPSRFDIEAEPSRCVAAFFGIGKLCVKFSDFIKQLDIGSRVAVRCAANGRLINGDHFVELFQPDDFIKVARIANSSVEFFTQRFDQDFVDEGTLAAAADAGNANKSTQWNFDRDIFQIVMPRATILSVLSGSMARR